MSASESSTTAVSRTDTPVAGNFVISLASSKSSKSGFIDLYVLQPGGGPDDPNAREDYPGVRRISGVAELVRFATEQCRTQKLRHLRIGSHGSSVHFYIGADYVSRRTLSNFETELTKLTPCFELGTSWVTIDACHTGSSKELLKGLSRIWGGIPVKAFFDAQSTERVADGFAGPVDNGPYQKCADDGCVVGHPVVDAVADYLNSNIRAAGSLLGALVGR